MVHPTIQEGLDDRAETTEDARGDMFAKIDELSVQLARAAYLLRSKAATAFIRGRDVRPDAEQMAAIRRLTAALDEVAR